MQYKLLVIRNRYTQPLNLGKGLDWFKNNTPLEIVIEEKTTDFDLTSKKVNNATYQGVIPGDDIYPKLRAIIPEGKYHAVVFIYGNDMNGLRVSALAEETLYMGTGLIYLVKLSDKGYTLNHELFHSFFKRLRIQQIGVDDPMDSVVYNGVVQPYFHNSDLDAKPSNRSIALERLQPYWDKVGNIPMVNQPPTPTPIPPITPTPAPGQLYKPKNFALKELVSNKTLAQFGDKAWEFFDARMLKNLQFIRDSLGPVKVNNGTTFEHRCFDAVEERKNGYSQHNHGRAVDFDVVGMTAEQVRQWIVANQTNFPEPNMWIEIGTNWVHIDVRYSDKKGVYLFNP